MPYCGGTARNENASHFRGFENDRLMKKSSTVLRTILLFLVGHQGF
jgi:hypothetical protein